MTYCELGFLMLPWAAFMGLIILFSKLVGWAKNRKNSAVALAVLVQMFLPDPNVEKTIEIVAEAKQEVKKQQDENGEPLDTQSKHSQQDKSDE